MPRKEQERLGRVLENARAQAQSRANISQAAVLLTEGRVEDADKLLRESPLESIEPSREAAGVFRALGSRNAIHGRWKQALQCFVLLDQANRLDNPVNTVSEGDLLMIGAMFLYGGDRAAYEKFRHETLQRYLPARDSLQAEHILKSCLLIPADKDILDILAPVAKVCAKGYEAKTGPYPAWESLAMALYAYRTGDLQGTLDWTRKTLSAKDTYGCRAASALSLQAMAEFQLGSSNDSRRDLGEAKRMVQEGTQFGPTWDESIHGSWFSWIVAKVLLDEAALEIEGAIGRADSARN